MADWTVASTQHEDGTLTHVLHNVYTGEQEPLVQWSLEQVNISDELLHLGARNEVIGFRWLWKPYLLRLCGMTWLVGRHDVLYRASPMWCANIVTLFFWLATWLWEWLELHVLYPPLRWLIHQGVLVKPEYEYFQYRRLWHYVTAPGHRQQRRYYHPTRGEIDCLSYKRGYDDGKQETQQAIAKNLEAYLQERRRR